MTRWDHALHLFVALWLFGTGLVLAWVAFKLVGVCR